ncbi:myeloid differentiation primary response protein MyD88-like [Antedon mediterranea]|uniref:myeloid differentiation primary response protein MyD88-like n=1 Tax=Antedon mediterranea TaxID=105859 RepID=UPI003AF47561
MAESSSEPSTNITEDVPAVALSVGSRNKLSRNLNYAQSLGNNWKALADELEFEYIDICNMERESDPTGELICAWSGKEDATISALIRALQEIQRYDVLTAVKDSFEKDARRWKEKRVQVPDVSPGTLEEGELYDAFICYTEKDYPFVMQMMEKLEQSRSPSEPPLKLCVDFRDILPGESWANVSVNLIDKRCKRMIIVLSPDFEGTPQCDFQTKFALSLPPGSQTRRIVPIKYRQCNVPQILAHLTVIDFTRKELRLWFWERLAQTLRLK